MNWDKVLTPINIERLLLGDLLTKGEMGGLLLTLVISVLAVICATLIGTVVGLMRVSERRALRAPAQIYIQGLRNVPLLILVFWAYFVPPYFGYDSSKFLSVAAALSLFTAAYIAEYLRSGIMSVHPGNIEAARALGLTKLQVQLWVVLPQAFFAMIPAITGRYIVTLKNTSLAFLIGLPELTEIGRQINVRLMTSPVEVYVTLMVIYFTVNRFLSWLMRGIESRDRFNRLVIRI